MDLAGLDQPDLTLFPKLLEGDLLLSYKSTASLSDSGGVAEGSNSGSDRTEGKGGSYGGSEGGVLWRVEASATDSNMMTWTVFPSTGLLFPGEK